MAEANNATTKQQDAVEDKFDISLAKPVDFDATGEIKLLTTQEFCKQFVNPLFKGSEGGAYADCIGSYFRVNSYIYTDPQTHMQTARYDSCIELSFDHLDHGSDVVVATTRVPSNDGMVNETVLATRRYANKALYGDKYYFTDEGKEGLDKFFQDRVRHRDPKTGKWKINYDKVKKTIGGNTGMSPWMGMPGQQRTVVSNIDPDRIARVVFGDTNEEGKKVDYRCMIVNSIPSFYPYQASSTYVVGIIKLNLDDMQKLGSRYGIQDTNAEIW